MSQILHHTLGERIHLETVLAGELWTVHADANQLENAVLNLAVNARDAMPEGGKLTIETANCRLDDEYASLHAIVAGQYVMVAVTDTGCGMTPDIASRAFEPFYSTKAADRGTGLGLSQVFGFVKQSGGHVKIYSEPGHGTGVKIYLPRYAGGTDVPAAVDASVISGARSETILAVEDDEQVLSLTVQMLCDLGYAVLPARTGAEALEHLQNHPEIALLFTDIVIPDIDGRDLAARATKLRPGLKVLFTTGYTRNATIHDGDLEIGANVLPKPATIEELATKLRAMLDSGT